MHTARRTNESHWVETTPPTMYPRLHDDISVDVAVVGGGMAGLSVAWELATAGVSVAVLEADRIATGVTGHTTAKLSALQTFCYDFLRTSASPEVASQYAQSQEDAIERVADIADHLGILCDLERQSAYTYVESPEMVDLVRAEVDAARVAGLPASFVTETPLPYDVSAAVKLDGQAQFHPRRYLLALADATARRGCQIYERTRIVDLHEGNPCKVVSEHGHTVTARDVVVATHYPIFDRAMLFTRLVPRRELVVTAAVPEDHAPSGMYITPEDGKRSVRTAPYRDGQRLLIISGESFTPGEAGIDERYNRLESWTKDRFGVEKITHRWAAQDNWSTDGLPYVGPLHPGARHTFVATGFGGWGLTNGVMSGRVLAAMITDDEPVPPWADLYNPRRLHPLREVGPALAAQANVAKHLLGDRLRTMHVDSLQDIAPDTGAVVRIGGERCAVYRAPDGTPHTVSATCTHLGCLVAFNDAERTWDCPCHGSRFAVNGDVINGPATRRLAPRDPTDTPR